MLLPFLLAAAAQSQAWPTYRDAAAGFAFDYPAGAHVSIEQEASQGYASVFVALPAEGAGYQGYAVTVFANPDDLALPRFLIERRGFASFGGQNLGINGVDALRAAPGTALAGDDAEAYWLRGAGVVVRLGLYAGRDRSIGPSKAAQAAFDRAVSSFRIIPREATIPITPPPAVTPLPDRPELVDAFSSPYGVISTTTAYDRSMEHHHQRHALWRAQFVADGPRKCWGVTWQSPAAQRHRSVSPRWSGCGRHAAGCSGRWHSGLLRSSLYLVSGAGRHFEPPAQRRTRDLFDVRTLGIGLCDAGASHRARPAHRHGVVSGRRFAFAL